MSAHTPTSPAPALNMGAKETQSDEPLPATTTTFDNPQESKTSSSTDDPTSRKSPIRKSEIVVGETPVQPVSGATSPAKSDASGTNKNPLLGSATQSVKDVTAPAKSAASGAHSQPPPGSNRSSAVSSTREGKDYETFGKDEDPYDVFKPKVIKLCHDIGYGEPTEFERMEGGSYNKIIGLSFASPQGQKFILRMPCFVYEDSHSYEIGDQISVLLYLSQFGFMKVPQVLAYDMTVNNAIGTQFVLQSRLPGSCMQDVFYKLTLPEKLQLTSLVAEMTLKMMEVKLPKPGRLIGPRILPPFSHTPPAPLTSIEIGGYREYPRDDPPAMEQQHLTPFLLDFLEARKLTEETSSGVPAMYRKLQKITREMQMAGLMRAYDVENVLWHWDFCARNILIEQQDVPNVVASGQLQSTEPLPVGDVRINADGPNDATELRQATHCHHSFQLAVEESSGNGHKHTVQVKIEDPLGTTCNHTVSVVVESNGQRYRHQLEIFEKQSSEQTQPRQAHDIVTQSSPEKALKAGPLPKSGTTSKQWVISGVLDWDDVLSVPLVIARRPHSWLWFDDEERNDDWTGNEDDKPHRDLTEDELLIKGHFDQIMARASPDYMEDAYNRGVWLRQLTRFARDGFGDSQDWKRYDKFIVKWAEHYKSLGFTTEEEVEDEESEGDESEEGGSGKGGSDRESDDGGSGGDESGGDTSENHANRGGC